MRKKCITIWILTTFTFIALIHLVEAITVTMLNNPIRLTQLYPFVGELLKSLSPATYLYVSALSTVILWGITCLVAFHNPVEAYLCKRNATEAQLQEKGELLDRMFETMESDHEMLAQLRDIVCKVQTEVKELQPIIQANLTAPKISESRKSKPQLNFPTTLQPAKTVVTKTQKTPILKTKNKTPKKSVASRKINSRTSASSQKKVKPLSQPLF
jgi:hypothetical protein